MLVSHETPGFEMRHQLTQQALLRAVGRFGAHLGDAEVVVDTSDGYSEMAGPVFVMSKFPSSSGGVLSPHRLAAECSGGRAAVPHPSLQEGQCGKTPCA